MNIQQIPCYVCAYEEDSKVMELRFEPVGEKSSLGNIYVGQIENIAANIGAAFVQISAGEKCYLQLSDAPNAIYASVKKGDRPLKAGDEILVQISREAMKGKLPAVIWFLQPAIRNLVCLPNFPMMTEAESVSGWKQKLTVRIKSLVSSFVQMQQMHQKKKY